MGQNEYHLKFILSYFLLKPILSEIDELHAIIKSSNTKETLWFYQKKRARHVIEEIIALFPDAKPSLDFRNHFELLVAVMLSAQTTDAAVNKATPALFEAFPTPQDMAVASEADIAKHISKLGLYRNKAKFLKKMCPTIVGQF